MHCKAAKENEKEEAQRGGTDSHRNHKLRQDYLLHLGVNSQSKRASGWIIKLSAVIELSSLSVRSTQNSSLVEASVKRPQNEFQISIL